MNTFMTGRNLEETRKSAGIPQKTLYQAVNVSRATYHNWIVGKSEPSVSQFFTMLHLCWKIQHPDLGPKKFSQQLTKLLRLETSE